MVIGHKIVGSGPNYVIAMHDWFSDCSSYDPMLPYLDLGAFTYAFMDLRGYGKSKQVVGKYDVFEASGDAIALADHLKWDRFHVVGHSMTGMVAQRIAIDAKDRIKSVVAICPTPASGAQFPPDIKAFLTDATQSNDEGAKMCINLMTSNQHSPQFVQFKLKQWRETSLPQARVAYMHMYSDTNFSSEMPGLKTPFLVITGGYDAEPQREPAMRTTILKWLPHAKLEVFANSGHYPMQETPVHLACVIEKFLGF